MNHQHENAWKKKKTVVKLILNGVYSVIFLKERTKIISIQIIQFINLGNSHLMNNSFEF